MPKCINDTTKTYKGDEPSPKGLGYCASAEESGKIMTGKDNKKYIVKEISNGQKRWYKITAIKLTPKEESNIEKIETETAKIEISSPSIRSAKFHDVSNDIFPNYKKNGYVGLTNLNYRDKIENYIEENKEMIKFGDILFVGQNSEALPRREDGFCIVLEDGTVDLSIGCKGPFLATANEKSLSNKVSYKRLFEELKDNIHYFTYFFEDTEFYDEMVEEYKTSNIW